VKDVSAGLGYAEIERSKGQDEQRTAKQQPSEKKNPLGKQALLRALGIVSQDGDGAVPEVPGASQSGLVK
jgi:hypothetical protein